MVRYWFTTSSVTCVQIRGFHFGVGRWSQRSIKVYDVTDMPNALMHLSAMPLEGLVPTRVASILAQNDIHTVEDVRKAYPHGLAKMRGLGTLRLKQIEAALFPRKNLTPGRIRAPISHVKGSLLNGTLSPAVVRALARNDIITVEKLRLVSSDELLRLPGLGHAMLKEIERAFPHTIIDVAESPPLTV